MRKLAFILISLGLLSWFVSSVATNKKFNHPVFQSFANFCLPLANSGDGYGDENIRKFAALANLQEGQLREPKIRVRLPAAKYYSGDINLGADLFVMRRFNATGTDNCVISSFAKTLPSANQFIAWLNKKDSDWFPMEDSSEYVTNKGKTNNSVRFCKALSNTQSLRVFYSHRELMNAPSNPKSHRAYLSLTDVAEACPEYSKK